MKTLLKTICLLLCLGFVTKSKAQTKEETVAWIKEKIEKYYRINSSTAEYTVFVNPCQIQLLAKTGNSSIDYKESYIFNPSVTKWIVTKEGVLEAEKPIITYKWSNLNSGSESKRNFIDNLDGSLEPNFGERMAKALNHLAIFCNEGKNETF